MNAMKTRRLLTAFLFIAAASAFAQSRGDVRIYIPPVSGNPAQAAFFQENFAMETSAAGYAVTQNPSEADYSLRLTVRPNVIVYADGAEEPAPPGEHQYILLINLIRNSDSVEVVSFSFSFTELEEMYNHNLSLLYQAMANVPLTKTDGNAPDVKNGDRVEDDRWRNKWVYLRASFDFPISYYEAKPDGLYGGANIYEGSIDAPAQYSRLEHQIIPMPGATVGLELQFLNWMSAEVNFGVQFKDPIGYTLIPGLGVQLKFPIKPARHFMLEPYLAASSSINTAPHSISFPRLAVGGGAQLGVKGGNIGAFFVDANFMYSLEEAQTTNPDKRLTKPEVLHWRHFVIGLGIGYKIGFFDRKVKTK